MVTKTQIAQKLRRRTIYSFVDLLILAELKNGSSTTCDDIVRFIHRKFDVTVGPGTVYAYLYSLELDELITGNFVPKKHVRAEMVYRITEKGKEGISKAIKQRDAILNTIMKILK